MKFDFTGKTALITGIGAGLDGILDCMARFGRVALLGCIRNRIKYIFKKQRNS